VRSRLHGRVKKLEGKKRAAVVHLIYVRPNETKEEALEIYKKRRTINNGDQVWVWSNMPIPDSYNKLFY
jgi:hypothetical protein